MFLGRKRELEELNKRFNSNKMEFGIIYGPRRIGKTSLLNEFLKDKKHIYFQAKQASDYDNLLGFSHEISKFFNVGSSFNFENIGFALEYIADNIGEEKIVLVIDEYSYFNNERNGYSSYFQDFIDNKLRDKKIMLILAVSNVSLMKSLLDRNAPLYQRQTFVMELRRLPFNEMVLFVKGINNEDKSKYLSIFGGFPYYLRMIDKDISFEENIYDLLFSEYGTLRDAPNDILSQCIRNQAVYNSILYAVANRKKSIKEISDVIHEPETKVSKYISVLIETSILEKRETFNGNAKMNYYEIADSLIRFWYKFVFNEKDKISLGYGKDIFDQNFDKINDFIAHAFEDLAISYMSQLNKDKKLGASYSLFKNYKVDNSKLGRSVEIDGLAEYENNLIVVECKYRKEKFSLQMFEHLKENVSIFDKYKHIEYYLFSKSGFANELKKLENVHLIELKDMFN